MKTLYLVRHAKSDWNEPAPSDFERPLNKRGEEAAPMMGKRLHEKKIKPQTILSSPAKRAMTTAQLLLAEMNISLDTVVLEPKIYNASLQQLMEVIHQIDNQYDSAMLFGHNPGFTELANYLGDQAISNMPTCSICVIEFAIDDWQAVASGLGTGTLFDYPKKGV